MYDFRENWKRREGEILGYGEKGASATDQFLLRREIGLCIGEMEVG